MLEQCININRMCPNYKLEFNNTNSQLLHVYTGALYAGQTRNYIVGFFSGRHLSVLRGHSFFSSPPQRPMTSDFEGFLYNYITLFSYLNSWERASIYPFQCSVLNKGTAGTIFITSLVWRGPWLGIEPGTSRTRSQHSTTKLSRRRYVVA